MKEAFKKKRFSEASLDRIDFCNKIISTYMAKGLRLTLRQLYYQFVARDLIPNSEKSYKALGSLVSDARLAGLLDWDAIEDRVRQPRKAGEYDDLDELARAAIRSYRLPRWADQASYVELWVEKDALAGVLWPIAHEYHVTLMVNRGYSSQSAMYESGKRFGDALREGKACTILYLGDHDPSGEDMVRDVADRVNMFAGGDDLVIPGDGPAVDVTKLALTMRQVRAYNPPPNPAKMSDSRARAYVEKHGNSSWEVDALPPDVLADIIRDALDQLVDREAMDAVIERENEDKKRLTEAVMDLMKSRGA